MKYISSILMNKKVISILALITVISACTSEPWRPFDPNELINKLLDASVQIVLVVFGFILLNVIWARHEKRLKTLPFDEYFLAQIERFGKIIYESAEMMSKTFYIGENDQVEQRDEFVQQNIRRLTANAKAMLTLINTGERMNNRTTTGFTYYLTDIQPDLYELNDLCVNGLRAHASEVETLLVRSGRNIENLRHYLKGSNDELNSIG